MIFVSNSQRSHEMLYGQIKKTIGRMVMKNHGARILR